MRHKRNRHRITVTASTIERSKTQDSSHCMAATAIREALPQATHVSVDIQTVRFTDRETGDRYIYLTPRHLQLKIIEFDLGRTPDAFTFFLSVPTIVNHRKGYARRVVMATPPSGHRVTRTYDNVVPPRAIGSVRQFGLRGFTKEAA